MDMDQMRADYARLRREQARLIVLKTLAGDTHGSQNSDILLHELRRFAIRESREWLHDELRWLENMGALRLTEAGSLLVATLTEKGQRHVDREIAIEGVKRPSRPEA
jgi:hypothetical protein